MPRQGRHDRVPGVFLAVREELPDAVRGLEIETEKHKGNHDGQCVFDVGSIYAFLSFSMLLLI